MQERESGEPKSSSQKTFLERAAEASAGPVKVVADALTDVTRAITDAVTECTKVTQTEKTQREAIRAQRDIALERIRRTHQLIERYLDHTYQERLVVLRKELEVIDAGLTSGNMEMLNSGLGSVTTLLQANPLQNVAEITGQVASGEFRLRLE